MNERALLFDSFLLLCSGTGSEMMRNFGIRKNIGGI